jgi:hypothetical protein
MDGETDASHSHEQQWECDKCKPAKVLEMLHNDRNTRRHAERTPSAHQWVSRYSEGRTLTTAHQDRGG